MFERRLKVTSANSTSTRLPLPTPKAFSVSHTSRRVSGTQQMLSMSSGPVRKRTSGRQLRWALRPSQSFPEHFSQCPTSARPFWSLRCRVERGCEDSGEKRLYQTWQHGSGHRTVKDEGGVENTGTESSDAFTGCPREQEEENWL